MDAWSATAIGSYEYDKWELTLTVAVYLMEVNDQEDKWEESRFRERAWSPVDSAFDLLKKHPVQPLLDVCRDKARAQKEAPVSRQASVGSRQSVVVSRSR